MGLGLPGVPLLQVSFKEHLDNSLRHMVGGILGLSCAGLEAELSDPPNSGHSMIL